MRLQIIDPNEGYACGTCSKCCQQPYSIVIEQDKAAALDGADFSSYPQLHGKEFYYASPDAPEGFFVVPKQGETTKCLFLDTDGLCIIHKELGPEAKPKPCLRFPYHDSPTFVDHRVSVNFGCPSVLGDLGPRLVGQQEEIAATSCIGPTAPNHEAFVALNAETGLPHADFDRLAQSLEQFFLPGRNTSIWEAFAASLNLVQATVRKKVADESDLSQWLTSEKARQDAESGVAIEPFSVASAAPSAVRMRFAATLLRDAVPKEVTLNMSLWRRLMTLPKLMPLAKLTGEYFSKVQQRTIDIDQVVSHSLPAGVDAGATELLKRCFRARIWQRFLIGTRLSVTAGLHQHIHDLNAILFLARADACRLGEPRLTKEIVAENLSRFEFNFANQIRLFRHNSLGWFTNQLNDIGLARSSLRLFALPAANTPCPAPIDVNLAAGAVNVSPTSV